MTRATTAPTDIEELRQVLLAAGRVTASARLTPLAGGVSSLVAEVVDGNARWVAKTPLARLAVVDEWRVDRRRGANEAAILAILDGQIGPARVPRLRFFDNDRVILGQELVAGPAPTYKGELLAGRSRTGVAATLGRAAAALHRLDPPRTLAGDGPRQLFEAQRLDPYYRATALRRPELDAALRRLILDTVEASPRRLVHGDFTPKNVLVPPGPAVVVDWEVVHTGDPAFDLGVMTAHLALKDLRARTAETGDRPFAAAMALWKAYDGPADRQRALRHAGAVMLARLYGKSPVEYLADSGARRRVHRVGEIALHGGLSGIAELDAAIGDAHHRDAIH